MSNIRVPNPWEMSERLVTSEDVYLNRRAFSRRLAQLRPVD